VIRYLRSRVDKADYRKVCTPKELAEAIADNGGLQNGGVQLLMLDRNRLDEIEEVIAEVSTAAKEYFSRASTYSFLPDDTKNSASDWRMAKYKVQVHAYAGIGPGAIFQVDLEEGSFEHLPDIPTDKESDNATKEGGGADNDDECSCDSNDGRHSDGEDSDDEDDCGNFVFVMGDAATDDEVEEEEEAENIGELAVRDIARSLASREIVRAKYTGKPQESIYNAPLPLTKVSVKFHQTFGRIKSKRESEKDNLQSTDEASDDSYTRRDLISKAISIAHEEIVSGRKVRIRDQKDEMAEYGMAKASRVSDSCLFRSQGWARRDALDDDAWGMYGATYMNEKYRAVVVELFEKGVEHSCNKMSPAQMREEIEERHPGFYCYPPESEITKCVSALFDAQKKANKGKKTKTTKILPEEVGLKIREFMAQHTSEKGAVIADRVAEFFGGADRIPGCTRTLVRDRVNSWRKAERDKAAKSAKRRHIG
jgi:hypothetical protein